MSKLKDSNGQEYESVRDFCRRTGSPKTSVLRALKKKGAYERDGITLTWGEKKSNPILDQIAERYTEEELKYIARGKGLQDKEKKREKIQFHGKKYKLAIISDGHLGSIYANPDWHKLVFDEAEIQGCTAILHVGDVVEGLTPRRISTQIYELSHIGGKAQKEHAIEVFKDCKLPIYVISGNHDFYFNEFAGFNIVEDICDSVPNMHYLGHDVADIMFDNIKIRLHHGLDGSSYALSYRLQKIVESYTGGDKPHILLTGHVHKFCYIFERHVHAISVPCLQTQSGFMKGKRLAAHTGFLILEFDAVKSGVGNLKLQLFPFYE